MKRDIVRRLASFGGYSDIAKAVTAEWGVAVTRWQVRSYDPVSPAYAAADKWRQIFTAER